MTDKLFTDQLFTDQLFTDPLLTAICKEFGITAKKTDVVVSDFDKSVVKKLKAALGTNEEVVLTRPVQYARVQTKTVWEEQLYKWQNTGLNLYFGTSKETYVSLYDKGNFTVSEKWCGIKLVIYSKNEIYRSIPRRTKRGMDYDHCRLVPLSIKDATKWCFDENPYYLRFFKILMEQLSKDKLIFKDIDRWAQKDDYIMLPMSFKDIAQYHNLKELFNDKYKLSRELPYNWNKQDINLSYMILKTWKLVDEKDRNKLLMMNEMPVKAMFMSDTQLSQKQDFFLAKYIEKLLDPSKVDDEQYAGRLAVDYVRMARMSHTPVRLGFKSMRKLQEYHDEVSDKEIESETPDVKIKKDTKFAELRKILPPEYEWITTRKRLTHETEIMHHCVWSYADSINRDQCQIYSYVSPATEKRYTMEFIVNEKGRYQCVQIQGVCDCGDPENLQERIDTLLNEAQKVC
jgi:hypothetical protein